MIECFINSLRVQRLDQIPTELANFCGEIPGTTFVYLSRQFVSLSLTLMKPQIVLQDHLPR